MIGDISSRFIIAGGWRRGQVPDSHLLQLATVPPLPAPDAGHAGILLRR